MNELWRFQLFMKILNWKMKIEWKNWNLVIKSQITFGPSLFQLLMIIYKISARLFWQVFNVWPIVRLCSYVWRIPYTDPLLTPSDRLWHTLAGRLCSFAWWAGILAKQTNSLPISARLKQPSLMQGGQKRRRRGPEARQSTVICF